MYRGLNRGQEEMFSILMISFFLPVKLLETPFPRKKKKGSGGDWEGNLICVSTGSRAGDFGCDNYAHN